VEYRGKKTNSVETFVVKTQIPWLGSKFLSPWKTVGPIDQSIVLATLIKGVLSISLCISIYVIYLCRRHFPYVRDAQPAGRIWPSNVLYPALGAI